MTPTPIALLQQAVDHGLTLAFEPPDTLTVKPARLCPPEFREKLRTYKPQLLALLQTKGLTWIEVFSERIGETVFFCEDDDTKGALVEAGAEPWSIYTKSELRQLVQQNRIAPFSSTELRKLHEIRRTFRTRIARGND